MQDGASIKQDIKAVSQGKGTSGSYHCHEASYGNSKDLELTKWKQKACFPGWLYTLAVSWSYCR